MAGNGKSSVFISYAGNHRPIAEGLKNWLCKVTHGKVAVFVADRDLPPGSLWYGHVCEKLNDTGMMIVLTCGEAISSPWVNLEVGYLVARGTPIVPVLLNGCRLDRLEGPLSAYEYLNGGSAEVFERILGAIKKHLNRRFAVSEPPPADLFKTKCMIGLTAVWLESAEDIYDAIIELIHAVQGPTNILATAMLHDRGERFENYLQAVVLKCAEAERFGNATDFTLIMSYVADAEGSPPPERESTIRQRLLAFKDARADTRFKIRATEEQLRMDVLIIGLDHVVIGFPSEDDDTQLKYGVRISNHHCAARFVHWFHNVVRKNSSDIHRETLKIIRG